MVSWVPQLVCQAFGLVLNIRVGRLKISGDNHAVIAGLAAGKKLPRRQAGCRDVTPLD
jgi:hypothetical protein